MKTINEEPKKSKTTNLKQSADDALDIVIAASLIAGAWALWNMPIRNTLVGDFHIYRIPAGILVGLVLWMFITGKRYRNK